MSHKEHKGIQQRERLVLSDLPEAKILSFGERLRGTLCIKVGFLLGFFFLYGLMCFSIFFFPAEEGLRNSERD